MNIRNAKYNELGTIDCEIEHDVYGWIPFTASLNDVEQVGRDLFASLQATATPWVLTAEELAERERQLELQLTAVRVALAREHATDIAMRVSVDQVIDSLPDSEVETLTFLYPAWSGDSLPMSVNQKVRYNGILYRVLQGHTTQADWTPDTVPALFTRFRDPVAEPQPWVQPQGAHDAYQVGEQVTHNGQTWTNNTADNVWEPGVFGWVVA